jgi:hypothetical protein
MPVRVRPAPGPEALGSPPSGDRGGAADRPDRAPAAALEPGRRPEQYLHAAWPSVAHASQVSAVLQARDGQLWLGTSEGLARFDGQRMTTFDPHGLPGMVGQNVRALLEAADGTLWIGSLGQGLSRLKDGRVSSWRPGDNARFVHQIRQTADGTVWVATRRACSGSCRGKRIRCPPGRACPTSARIWSPPTGPTRAPYGWAPTAAWRAGEVTAGSPRRRACPPG